MKRLPLFGVIAFGLASCVVGSTSTDEAATNRPPSLDQIAEPIDEMLACYDTGHGTKCVERRLLPKDAIAMCTDGDGYAEPSDSSDSGPSADDDETSDSSDSPNGPRGCNEGDSSSSTGDESGNSDSDAPADGCENPDGDADLDGVPNNADCDCACPDGDPPPAVCGNGIVEGDEQCDDGNTTDLDFCSNACIADNDPGSDKPAARITSMARY
jgi:cysteine-rich repeat protein